MPGKLRLYLFSRTAPNARNIIPITKFAGALPLRAQLSLPQPQFDVSPVQRKRPTFLLLGVLESKRETKKLIVA
jgi:hypothetical protein